MKSIPVEPGIPVELAEGVVRLTAPNPGVMTGPGTNSYLVGKNRLAVIDPGPLDNGHIDAIEELGAGRIEWIVLTHGHPDHAPSAPELARRTGASLISIMSPHFIEGDFLGTGKAGLVGHQVPDDRSLTGEPGLEVKAIYTPGHASDHICWYQQENRLLFTGDHIMGGSTVVIAPTDGDMGAYLNSLALLKDLDPKIDYFAPGHGPVLDEPTSIIDSLINHRLGRESLVEGALFEKGKATVDELVPVVYSEVNEALFAVARFSLWAHLRHLAEIGRATVVNADDIETVWTAAT